MSYKHFSPLVLTKLRVPSARPQVISRPRLLDRLTLEPGTVLFLLCAPAGYGKTTLLVEWANLLLSQGAAVAWLSLDPSDDDPHSFASYLTASLVEALGSSETLNHIQQVLRTSPELEMQRIMQLLINTIAQSNRECVLFLDDYHLISDPVIHDSVQYLLEHIPENLRLVMGTRVDPPIQLARLRARGNLVEFRTQDLRFLRKEAEAFLNESLELGLTPDLVRDLETRTEGWAAGLQLASLSLSGRSDREGYIAAFSGSERFLAEYLLDEVLGKQAEEVQHFLLATSILNRFNLSLCDAVTGEAFESAAILSKLEQADLFLISLEESGWYRYHHLFRDFLQRRMKEDWPGQEIAFFQRASKWFEQNKMLREAAFHAFQSGDWEYAAAFVEENSFALITLGEISLLADWCAEFPEEFIENRPQLCILQCWAWVLTFSRRYHPRIHARLEQAEQAIGQLSDKQVTAELREHAAVVRSFIAMAPDLDLDPHPFMEFTDQMLKGYPEGDPGQYSALLWKGYVHLALQNTKAARDSLEKARQSAIRGRLYFGIVEASFHLARLAHMEGDLDQAEMLCIQGKEAVKEVTTDQADTFPAAGSLDVALGCVLLDRNQLEEAELCLLRGLELIRGQANPFHLATVYTALARLNHIRGRKEKSEEYLSRLEDSWPDAAFLSRGKRIDVRLSEGSEEPSILQEAAGWCRKFEKSFSGRIPEPGMGPLGAAEIYFEAFLVWVRLCAALRDPDRALEYLKKQKKTAACQGLRLRIIQLLTLEAQLAYAAGQETLSKQILNEALAEAEDEGFLQQFNQGLALTEMLKRYGQDHPQFGLIEQILKEIEKRRQITTARIGEARSFLLPGGEHLTEREAEVLVLISQGASNKDISKKLYISVGTVKSHINRILGKLNAQNRTEAAAIARELELFGT